MQKLIIDSHNRFWINKDNYLHRKNGPALEWADGYRVWCINGKFIKEEIPANTFGDLCFQDELLYLNLSYDHPMIQSHPDIDSDSKNRSC